MIASIVETGKLLDVVLYALAATVGVALLFSLAVLGAARASEARGRSGGAVLAYGAIAAVCLLACLGAAAWGIVLLSSK